MNPELKSMSIWAAYVVALGATCFAIHEIRLPGEASKFPLGKGNEHTNGEPPPINPDSTNHSNTGAIPIGERGTLPPTRKPLLTVTTNPRDLQGVGEVRVLFKLDQPAPSTLKIGYHLSSQTFELDGHSPVETTPDGTVVIEQGKHDSLLVLKKTMQNPPRGPASWSTRTGDLVMALSKEAGFDYAPNTQRTWTFPLTMTEYGRPFQVSLSSTRAFQERDARRKEEIDVVFQLDRPPTDHAVSIRFLLGGTARSADYEVVDRPRDDALRVQPNKLEAKLVLRRLPGPRGLGDRVIEVAAEPVSPNGELSFATGRHLVKIAIPDPTPELDWSIPQSDIDARDPRKPASTTLTVTNKHPSSERIVFRYRIVSTNRSGVPAQERTIELPPPTDLWSAQNSVATQILEFPPDDLMLPFNSPSTEADLAMRFRVEPAGDSPYQPKPIALRVLTSDKKELAGRVLVILVHTSDPGGSDDLVWSEFRKVLDQAEKDELRKQLVDRSIFVLDGDKDLYRLRLESIKHLERFPRDAALDHILDKFTKALFQNLLGRISQEEQANAKIKKVLVLRDLGKKPASEVVKALNEALPGDNWWVYCIDPNADESSLAREIGEVRKEVELEDFAIFKDKLAERLLALLRGGG